MAFDVKEYVTQEFIKSIESDGKLVWDKPWRTGRGTIEFQRNLNSKRPYRGFVNQLLLLVRGYESPYWMTYKGALELAYKEWARGNKIKIEKSDLVALKSRKRFEKMETYLARMPESVQGFYADGGGGVMKGEEGTLVVFWKVVPNKKYVKDSEDPATKNKNIFLLRYYKVFNHEQTKGITVSKVEVEDDPNDLGELFPHLPQTFLNQDAGGFSPIIQAGNIIEGMPNPPSFKHNGRRAMYNFVQDHYEVPEPTLFVSPEEYYSTRYHEMVHATGHESRLKRKFGDRFGDDKYSMEELVAEMGAAMLCAYAGIEKSVLENSKAYVQGWVKKLRDPDNKGMIITASARAQKAVDYILDTKLPSFDDGEDE